MSKVPLHGCPTLAVRRGGFLRLGWADSILSHPFFSETGE
jgi:hypothetical protein